MDPETDKHEGETPNEALLREIREDFDYFRDYWRDNHEEAKTDLRYASGDPWEPDVRKEREDLHRPVVSPDELDQYLNQAINNLRQNKRSIKVNPKGAGATDDDAARREDIVRGIEYKSNAQAAYTNAFDGQVTCGFGAFRITTKRIGKEGEVEPRIKIIENPLSVLPDPFAKEPDFSDMKKCFVLDTVRVADFGRRFPKAQKKSFTATDKEVAPNWFLGDQALVVAEYWRVEGYNPDDGSGGTVYQYLTNGLEILKKTKWDGSWVPIILATGKKVYVPRGGEMKRMYYSMIRKARGPQMMLAYIASQEAEEYGMAPRAPFVGYVGQFETDKDAWQSLNKVPRSFVQVDPVVDTEGGKTLLPLPTRVPFTPNAQAYEIGFERWRRSVQAAMGITPLPTAAQRQNEKSGVALQRIETQQAIGSFHFTDNFDLALENAGRQINELITKVMDTEREVPVRKQDEKHALMRIVPGGKVPEGANPNDVFDPTKGEFDVTISTGPSFQSQRDEASQFVDLLVQEMNALPIAPPLKQKILALAVRLKNVGPIGDEISEILDPQGQQDIPAQAQQAIGQLQDQLMKLNAACKEYEQKIQQLEFEKQAKMLDNQAKLDIEKLRLEANVAEAEITTKAQSLSERMQWLLDLSQKLMDQHHEAGMAQMQQGHEADMQAGQQGHEAEMAAAQQSHESDLAQQQADNAAMQQQTQIQADQQAAQQSGAE